MKEVTIILSLLILFLSLNLCSDGNIIEDQHSDQISINHNHQQDSDDSCPITCICNCCGISITDQPLATFDINLHSRIPTLLFSIYQSNYRFNFYSCIWQPPQLIS